MREKLRFDDDEVKDKTATEKPIKTKRKPQNRSFDKEKSDSAKADTPHPPNEARREESHSDEKSSSGSDTADYGDEATDTADTSENPKADSKLKFSKEEKKIGRLEEKADQYGRKSDKAREKLPTRKVRKKERVFGDKTGRTKTKLKFATPRRASPEGVPRRGDKEVVPIGEAKWNKVKKKSIPKKAVGVVKTAGVNKLHSKIYEVEHENVGTQAAHKAELMGESTYRGGKKLTKSAYRFARNRPYRKASKLETKTMKNQMKLSYQKSLHDNPKLKSNLVSRLFQKRSIKRQYATALKKAKNSAKTAKTTGGVVTKVSNVVTGLIRRNPMHLLKLGALLLIIFLIVSLFTMCGNMLSGGTAFIGAASYAAENADIDNAELSYTEWETDLQVEIANAESTHAGYDEYRYNVGDIGHDPFELMGFLTSVYEDFTYSEIQGILQGIYDEQYSLSFLEEIEVRYRTEYYTDEDGEEQSEEVPYDWYILNVNLVSKSFSQVINPRMNGDQQEHFEILMETKGARQYVGNPFDFNWLPYVTSFYGYRIHPISGSKNYHKGVDIGLPTGTEIRAGFDGTVTTASYDSGYGNYVVVTNKDGVESKYAHCDTLLVSNGQSVKKGDVIATVGNTGDSTGPHLHIEVVKDGQYLNPIYFAETGDDGSDRIPPGSPGGVDIPDYSGEPMGDGSYAALLAEAQRWIGMPYVFGGSSPSTSFDCSGYISWIINQSGVGSVGRQTAQGLYNLSTPVSAANAQPGDLIFFHSTYSTANTVTHVALYLGGNRFIHCGDPIGYASLDSSYWQQHFYAFGRL